MPLSTRRSFTRRTPRDLFGKNGLMMAPFGIAEFVAHDPRLQFRSLKHVSGSAINPQQLAEYFRFQWILLQNPLAFLPKDDSVALMRFAVEAIDDGAAQSRPRRVFLFISS